MEQLCFLSEYKPGFEMQFIALRTKEGRVLSDEQVKNLPNEAKVKLIYNNEWKLRGKTAKRFTNYVSENSFKNILDLGCGNGWFSHKLSKIQDCNVTGLDMNKQELEQAIRVFGNTNPVFYYGNIFENIFQEKCFDLIVLNAMVQYFPELTQLIQKLNNLLSDKGEIHILDSPFYPLNEVSAAQKRSLNYFKQLGFPQMTKYYHHHSYEELNQLKAYYMYMPAKGIFSKFMNQTPFPWIRINKKALDF